MSEVQSTPEDQTFQSIKEEIERTQPQTLAESGAASFFLSYCVLCL